MATLVSVLLTSWPQAQGIEDLLEELTADAAEMERQAADDDGEAFLDEGLDELLGDVDPSAGGSEASVLKSSKGFLELRPRVYVRDRDTPNKNDSQLLLEGELELEFRFHEGITGYVRPRVFVDTLDGDLDRFEPYEAFVTFEHGTWDLRLGQFVENWGIVDTYNPIDIINRRDFATDFLDPDRLGELGLRYRRFFSGGSTVGEPTVSFYALPFWRETLFPTEDSRFSFGTETLPFEPDASIEPEGFERGLYAGRFQSTLETKPFNADLQVLVARGPERGPVVVADSLGPDPQLIPVYFGARTVGAGLRAVPNEDALGHFLATLTFKAEVVHKNPYRYDDTPIATPDDYLAYVFGLDRTWYSLFRDQDQLTATVEYAGESGADDEASRFRAFRDDLVLRALWEANDFARRSLELRGIYDLETNETIVESVFETQLRAIHEDLKLILQVQVFDPPETGESLFDLFPNNTLVALGLRWDL